PAPAQKVEFCRPFISGDTVEWMKEALTGEERFEITKGLLRIGALQDFLIDERRDRNRSAPLEKNPQLFDGMGGFAANVVDPHGRVDKDHRRLPPSRNAL